MKQWKRDVLIETKDVGKEKHVFLASPDKQVGIFIKHFGRKLDNYEKQFNKHLIALKKNKPLISPKQPMKRVKIKRPLFVRDKKDGFLKPSGKFEDDHAMTWKIRARPRRHLEILLNLLSKLYQESSVITYATDICNDPKLIKAYQKRSNELITNTVNKIENMFKGKKDGVEYLETDLAYVIGRLRNVLYGFIYKATMEAEFTKPQ